MEKGPEPRIGFLTVSEQSVPYPKTGHLDAGQLRPTTTGSCRGRQDFTGVKTVRAVPIHHPVVKCIPIRPRTHYGHLGAVEQIADAGNAESRPSIPRNRGARSAEIGTSLPLIVLSRKRPVSFPIFEGTHARGSTKYPCDPIS